MQDPNVTASILFVALICGLPLVATILIYSITGYIGYKELRRVSALDRLNRANVALTEAEKYDAMRWRSGIEAYKRQKNAILLMLAIILSPAICCLCGPLVIGAIQ